MAENNIATQLWAQNIQRDLWSAGFYGDKSQVSQDSITTGDLRDSNTLKALQNAFNGGILSGPNKMNDEVTKEVLRAYSGVGIPWYHQNRNLTMTNKARILDFQNAVAQMGSNNEAWAQPLGDVKDKSSEAHLVTEGVNMQRQLQGLGFYPKDAQLTGDLSDKTSREAMQAAVNTWTYTQDGNGYAKLPTYILKTLQERNERGEITITPAQMASLKYALSDSNHDTAIKNAQSIVHESPQGNSAPDKKKKPDVDIKHGSGTGGGAHNHGGTGGGGGHVEHLDSAENFGKDPALLKSIETALTQSRKDPNDQSSPTYLKDGAQHSQAETTQAWQQMLKDRGYLDKAKIESEMQAHGLHVKGNDNVDGDMRGWTRLATQMYLRDKMGYQGPVDGSALNDDAKKALKDHLAAAPGANGPAADSPAFIAAYTVVKGSKAQPDPLAQQIGVPSDKLMDGVSADDKKAMLDHWNAIKGDQLPAGMYQTVALYAAAKFGDDKANKMIQNAGGDLNKLDDQVKAEINGAGPSGANSPNRSALKSVPLPPPTDRALASYAHQDVDLEGKKLNLKLNPNFAAGVTAGLSELDQLHPNSFQIIDGTHNSARLGGLLGHGHDGLERGDPRRDGKGLIIQYTGDPKDAAGLAAFKVDLDRVAKANHLVASPVTDPNAPPNSFALAAPESFNVGSSNRLTAYSGVDGSQIGYGAYGYGAVVPLGLITFGGDRFGVGFGPWGWESGGHGNNTTINNKTVIINNPPPHPTPIHLPTPGPIHMPHPVAASGTANNGNRGVASLGGKQQAPIQKTGGWGGGFHGGGGGFHGGGGGGFRGGGAGPHH